MATDDEIKAALEKKNYLQAVTLATGKGLSPEEISRLQAQTLWKAAAVDRNPIATKILANQYGFSKEAVRDLLLKHLEGQSDESDDKALKPRYDYTTNRYLDFSQWMEQLFSKWNKLPIAYDVSKVRS